MPDVTILLDHHVDLFLPSRVDLRIQRAFVLKGKLCLRALRTCMEAFVRLGGSSCVSGSPNGGVGALGVALEKVAVFVTMCRDGTKR